MKMNYIDVLGKQGYNINILNKVLANENGDDMRYTQSLIQYVTEHHIDMDELAKQIGVEPQLFCSTNQTRALNATEFLTVCQYLGIKPENL